MIFLIFIILFLLIFVIALFAFPSLSPVPYFPSNHKDIDLIIKEMKLKDDDTIVDLGAGDGVVIFRAASYAYTHRLNTKFIAIEINPILIIVMHILRLLHRNRRNILIKKFDMFNKPLNTLPITTPSALFYMHLSPRYLPVLAKKISKLKIKKRIVTYFYSIDGRKADTTISSGLHSISLYQM